MLVLIYIGLGGFRIVSQFMVLRLVENIVEVRQFDGVPSGHEGADKAVKEGVHIR